MVLALEGWDSKFGIWGNGNILNSRDSMSSYDMSVPTWTATIGQRENLTRHQRCSSIALASPYVPRIGRLPLRRTSDDAEDLLRNMSRGDARYVPCETGQPSAGLVMTSVDKFTFQYVQTLGIYCFESLGGVVW
jgi:hypothetical protein